MKVAIAAGMLAALALALLINRTVFSDDLPRAMVHLVIGALAGAWVGWRMDQKAPEGRAVWLHWFLAFTVLESIRYTIVNLAGGLPTGSQVGLFLGGFLLAALIGLVASGLASVLLWSLRRPRRVSA